jgi:hypothetical protein
MAATWLPADETAVFMDEVEVHTNPKVGAMWMRRGRPLTRRGDAADDAVGGRLAR